jgi:hypothetical protein
MAVFFHASFVANRRIRQEDLGVDDRSVFSFCSNGGRFTAAARVREPPELMHLHPVDLARSRR